MIVEIVFADNRTEHIEVRDGDDPSQLARQFLATYKLPASYEKVLREQIVASIAEDERQRQLTQLRVDMCGTSTPCRQVGKAVLLRCVVPNLIQAQKH